MREVVWAESLRQGKLGRQLHAAVERVVRIGTLQFDELRPALGREQHRAKLQQRGNFPPLAHPGKRFGLERADRASP